MVLWCNYEFTRCGIEVQWIFIDTQIWVCAWRGNKFAGKNLRLDEKGYSP